MATVISPAAPVVMHPVFSPTATLASLVTFVMSLAVLILSLPAGLLAHYIPASTLQVIMDVCTVVTFATGAHMSVSRSLLPAVDGTKSVTVDSASTVEVH